MEDLLHKYREIDVMSPSGDYKTSSMVVSKSDVFIKNQRLPRSIFSREGFEANYSD